MLLVLLTMLLIVVLAALVASYVIFPRRGREVPRLPGAARALSRAVQGLPTLPRTVGASVERPALAPRHRAR